ncbi:hypothetical protein BN14_09527 [Rhizoctonia solani AG-1 IB]|uniref:Uncharacterized protein n=1 Tax=Thanatephorus cucumeris (strain AG1-IB / isolate 7/3/14) TaxID=1108050 RepID=M5C7U0_THACB|nr:hypothetical protein BN14_09527 [Rhizoctonia solani AG-1 IB]
MLFGAEAVTEEARESADEHKWSLAKRFKLLLHPKEMREKFAIKVDPLPNGVTLPQIYADFMKYLIKHTEPYFKNRIVDGSMIWEAYKDKTIFVIGHPNGWSLREQEFLRKAAIKGGLVDTADAKRRVRFVTEAEASSGFNFAVCDAGGSTVDTAVYTVTATEPFLKLAEKREAACVQAGGLAVDDALEEHLETTLTRAGMDTKKIKECLREGIDDFEVFPKRQFLDDSDSLRVKLGDKNLMNPEFNIRRGTITISSPIPKQCFDRSVKPIMRSVDDQIIGASVSHILLVGGFGDSPYLQRQLKDRYEPLGSELTIVNDSRSKAVAEGAILWNTMTSVFKRAPKWSYGIQGYVRVDSHSSEHRERNTFTTPDGYEKVTGVWCEIVKKGVALDADHICRQSFFRTYSSANPNLENIEIALYSYSGNDRPKWLRSSGGEHAGHIVKYNKPEQRNGFSRVWQIQHNFARHYAGSWQQSNVPRYLREFLLGYIPPLETVERSDIQSGLQEQYNVLKGLQNTLTQKEEEIKSIQSAHKKELENIQTKRIGESFDHETELKRLNNIIQDQKVELSKLSLGKDLGAKELETLKNEIRRLSSDKISEINRLQEELRTKDESLTQLETSKNEEISKLTSAKDLEIERLKARLQVLNDEPGKLQAESEREIRELTSQANAASARGEKNPGGEVYRLNAELRRVKAEYASLRNHTQLQENTEQAAITTALDDINRLIEELVQSLAERIEEHLERSSPKQTLNRQDLLSVFSRDENGLALKAEEDTYLLFEYAIQATVCDQLYAHLFRPFHPSIAEDEKCNKFITEVYDQMIRQGKFIKIQPHEVLEGYDKALGKVIAKAEWLNRVLKEEVSILGNFQLISFSFGDAFQPSHMSEAISTPKKPYPEIILATVGLGLLKSYALGGDRQPETTILRKAVVFGPPK